MYRLSFIIPVYNVENYVLPCLESAARAGGGRCEIVIVDDGSTDKSGEICDAFAKEHPEAVVIHQKNAGLGGARNTGIEAARGEYLFFLDSDDTVTNDAADIVLSVLDETDADILEFRIRGHREDGSELYTTSQPLEAGRIYDVKNDKFILTVTPSACDKVSVPLFSETRACAFPIMFGMRISGLCRSLRQAAEGMFIPTVLYTTISAARAL